MTPAESPQRELTPARLATFAALGLAAVIVAVLLLGGGSSHSYKLRFINAGQLVKGDEVQVGGHGIGTIKKLTLTDDNEAEVTISVNKPFAPLHEGTTGVIRATSLSGIANRYIALTLGPQNRPELHDGATLKAESTTAPVDLDQLFDTLDPKTRADLDLVIHGSSEQYDARGKEVNAATRYFNPALAGSSRLVGEAVRDQRAFDSFVRTSSRVVTALAARRGDLTNLVTNANTTAAAIGDENVALARALGLLPGTLRKANTTFVNLRATLDDLDVLVDASKPATKRLAAFLRELRPLVADAKPTIADLRVLVKKPGKGNDLTDLLNKMPRLERAAKPVFANSITALRKTTPVLNFIRPYTPELVGWFRDFGVSTSNYDANGHFARIQPIFNLFSVSNNPAGPVISGLTNGDRLAGLGTGNDKRCPGAASQPNADGSSLWLDSDGKLDCDKSQVLPGP